MCDADDLKDSYQIARAGTYSPRAIYLGNPVAKHRGGADLFYHNHGSC